MFGRKWHYWFRAEIKKTGENVNRNECHPPLPTVRKRLGFTHDRAVITRLPIKDCHVSAGPAISCPPCSDLNDDVTECSCRVRLNTLRIR